MSLDGRARIWRGAFACLACAASIALVASSGCKRQSTTTDTNGNAMTNGAENKVDPTTSAIDPNNPSAAYDPLAPHPHALPPAEAPRDNIDIPTGTTFVPGTVIPAPPPAPGDPLAASIAQAKAGAVPCFATLPSAEWAATLVLTVTPTGTVTRSEVEPGNVSDAGVLSCLASYAASLTFAQSEGRTLRIEVRVKG